MDLDALVSGDTRALARALSALEARSPGANQLAQEVWRRRRQPAEGATHIVGLTGPPGAGKSTLVDSLIELWRGEDRRVAVLAVDPNSPFTGGAILGDRVRMQRHALDRGVFIRSMGSRGHLGGVALATRAGVRLLDALGWDLVLVETVGVGQSELEICEVADSVVVVVTPASGDGVQVIKAGITEIADIFAVNKSDLPGADRVSRELRDLARGVSRDPGSWRVEVARTVATEGPSGVGSLAEALARHHLFLRDSGELAERARRRVRDEVVEMVGERASEFAREQMRQAGAELLDPDPRLADPERAATLVTERFAASWAKMASPAGPPGGVG